MPITIDGTGSISGLSAGGLPDASVTNDEIVSLAAPKLTGDIAADRLLSALNASGSAPIYACRAWVNFNGAGTVAIRASGNVSSITDNGVGDYNVNFTTAMPDANFAVAGTAANATNAALSVQGLGADNLDKSSSAARIIVGYANIPGSNYLTLDVPAVSVAIFR